MERFTAPIQDDFKIRVLAVGLERSDLAALAEQLVRCDVRFVPSNLELLMDPFEPNPLIVLCGRAPKNSSLDELGQLLRLVYQESPIYLVCMTREQYDVPYLVEMGYTEVHLSPIDWMSLKRSLADTIAKISLGRIKAFHPVKLIDIQPGTILDFDTFLYLPVNDRYVHYSKQGDPIDPERADQLIHHKVGTIYIKSERIKDFYRYVAERIKANSYQPDFIGVTERKEKLRQAVHDFFSRFFQSSLAPTEEAGQQLTQEIKKLVHDYILQPEVGNWYLPLLNWIGENHENYTHASNIALYASLFSTGLGVGNPEDLAIAGLLHDAGLANVSTEIQSTPESRWTPAEKRAYQRHPEFSLSFMKNRKLGVSERALKIIHQHHELYDGNGFPRRLSGDQICMEAQILALADLIDHKIAVEPGKPMLSPIQAIQALRAEGPALNPELIRKVLEIFPSDIC